MGSSGKKRGIPEILRAKLRAACIKQTSHLCFQRQLPAARRRGGQASCVAVFYNLEGNSRGHTSIYVYSHGRTPTNRGRLRALEISRSCESSLDGCKCCAGRSSTISMCSLR